MKINSAVTTSKDIKFSFKGNLILTINDNGKYSWYQLKIKNERFYTYLIILFCLATDMINFYTIMFQKSMVVNYISLAIIIYIIIDQLMSSVRERHAIEHIITTAYSDNHLNKLNINDRFDPHCGMRYAVYIFTFLLIYTGLFGISMLSLVFCSSLILDICLKKWKKNPVIKISLFLQRLTTTVPSKQMLDIYHKAFKKAIKEKFK